MFELIFDHRDDVVVLELVPTPWLSDKDSPAICVRFAFELYIPQRRIVGGSISQSDSWVQDIAQAGRNMEGIYISEKEIALLVVPSNRL